jgi:hypothetical protein
MDDEASLVILLCGGAAVGKTSVARRFLEHRFRSEWRPTIGVDLVSVPLPPLAGADGARPALLLMCDPSHLELLAEWPELVSGAAALGMLLIVDPSQPHTLREADAWLLRARTALRFSAGEEHALLLAHKHDVAGVAPPLGPHQLDAYCAQRGLLGWMHSSARCVLPTRQQQGIPMCSRRSVDLMCL